MLKIGCHLSAAKGFAAMGRDALKINANVFQFFTRNPRGGKAKALDQADLQQLLEIAEEHHFGPLLAHAPYTLNACSADEKVRQFAVETMADDLFRLQYIPEALYNFHPGSHVGQGAEIGIGQIITMLNTVLKPEITTMVLLETMSGKGSEIGRSFEEIKAIIDGVAHGEKMGVCFDICHVHDAGYDIIGNLDGVLAEFDRIIGLERLKAIHLNDSMNGCGSHKDRHAKIGQGEIGLETITAIINHPKLKDLPFYLETPNELAGYGEEIALLRNLYQEGEKNG